MAGPSRCRTTDILLSAKLPTVSDRSRIRESRPAWERNHHPGLDRLRICKGWPARTRSCNGARSSPPYLQGLAASPSPPPFSSRREGPPDRGEASRLSVFVVQTGRSTAGKRPPCGMLNPMIPAPVTPQPDPTIPDLAARLAERERLAEENKPRYARIIDVICEEYGMELVRITAGDPGFIHEGEERVAWHFLAGRGHYSMVDMGEQAVVFDDGGEEVAVVDISRVPAG